MNIIEAQVSQVTRDGDTYTIPPILVCKRYTHLALTVLYDILIAGVVTPWDSDHLDNLCEQMDVPERYRYRAAVIEYIEKNGRVVIDLWDDGPVTHYSHVEPVQ